MTSEAGALPHYRVAGSYRLTRQQLLRGFANRKCFSRTEGSMTDLREAVDMVVEFERQGAALMELRVQRIIAQSESEAQQEHMWRSCDQLMAEFWRSRERLSH